MSKTSTNYYLDWDRDWNDSRKLLRVRIGNDVWSYQSYDASKKEFIDDWRVTRMLIGELWYHRISENDAKRVIAYFNDLYDGNNISIHDIDDIKNNIHDYVED